jgi:hypothetical protein
MEMVGDQYVWNKLRILIKKKIPCLIHDPMKKWANELIRAFSKEKVQIS